MQTFNINHTWVGRTFYAYNVVSACNTLINSFYQPVSQTNRLLNLCGSGDFIRSIQRNPVRFLVGIGALYATDAALKYSWGKLPDTWQEHWLVKEAYAAGYVTSYLLLDQYIKRTEPPKPINIQNQLCFFAPPKKDIPANIRALTHERMHRI